MATTKETKPKQVGLDGKEIIPRQVKEYVTKFKPKRERYRMFAEAYLDVANPDTYLNIYKSAQAAGYCKAYCLGSSYRLLQKPGVQAEIEHIKSQRKGNPNIMTAEEVLETLTTQIRVLPNQLLGENGELIPLNKLTDRTAQAIAGFEQIDRIIPGEDDNPTTERRMKYKLVDRQKSLEMMGRHHGLFDKDNRQKTEATVQALVAFPMGNISLEDWQRQTLAILAQSEADKAKAATP
jgi:phage terminase small subunit